MHDAAVREIEIEGVTRRRRPGRGVDTIVGDLIASLAVVEKREHLAGGTHRHRHRPGGLGAVDVERRHDHDGADADVDLRAQRPHARDHGRTRARKGAVRVESPSRDGIGQSRARLATRIKFFTARQSCVGF